jgi:hypothetical protein
MALVTETIDNEMIREIARDVITRIAPQELPIFSSISEAYFTDPKDATKSLTSEDRLLGFGLDPTATLLTPVVFAALSEVFQFLVNIAKTAVEDGLGKEIPEVIKYMFRRFSPPQPPAGATALENPSLLSVEQIRLVREKVLKASRSVKLRNDKATLLANAVAAQFLTAER